MKAVVLKQTGGPERLRVEEVETPAPGAGQVRVSLRASALNRRDVWITLGKYPKIRLPCILGSDGAGVVDQVGAGVDQQLVGREVIVYPACEWGDDARFPGRNFRVLGMPDPGTFAESICVPATNVFAKPELLDWTRAAAIPLAGLTAWRAVVTQAAVRAGETVVVTGCGGGVATFALKWAIGLGARVFATSSSQDKLDRATTLGAAGGVDYRDEHWLEQLRELSGGGVDAVIDGTGGPAFNDYCALLNSAGRMVVYGATAGSPDQGFNMPRLFFRQLQIRGSTMGTPDEFAAMLDFIAERRIEPVVDRVFGLDDVVAAHQHLLATKQMGKVVLRQG